MCVINSPLAMIKGAVASLYPPYFVDKKYENFFFPLAEKLGNLVLETGYLHLQATKPDTIGAALTNNPIGLAAYILEKFATWTHPKDQSLVHGGLDTRKDLQDAILDNIMIYYLTNSITTSMRLYAESFSLKQRANQLDRVPTAIPTGCARFKNDLIHLLDWQLQDKYHNLIHSTFHEKGGHFIAMEAPSVLYQDFINFVKKVEKFNKSNNQ
ncbi:Juvenile hormone epoxide hydrolase 1 [Pseudolycoriella hygida]|uniref:Juvenile hormone epoxide hydrolase 1 n=1 Tax=Pseudolycoriella hygida TaxID=35572 RepID=A0A9Q0N3G8_9DIPT|nr:Juvenile hormone epoxide hydrolase 1 [Pseudolycoriella hygida]